MSHRKILFVLLASISIVASPGFAMDLEDELLETEALLNDSEASREYSEETAVIMAKEAQAAKAKIAEAKRQQQSASRALKAADAKIAANEKATDKARAQRQKAVKDIAKAQNDRQRAEAKLQASNAKLQQAKSEKENTLRQLRAEKQNLTQVKKAQSRVQAKAKQVAQFANKTKRDVKNARARVRNAVKAKSKSFATHRKMISKYRSQLHKALEQLDGLETLIEANTDSDRRMADLGR